MKENSLPRIVVIILCAVVFIAVLVVNALAAAGRGELKMIIQDTRAKVEVTESGLTRAFLNLSLFRLRWHNVAVISHGVTVFSL